jgi:hypothetical protein
MLSKIGIAAFAFAAVKPLINPDSPGVFPIKRDAPRFNPIYRD